MTYNETLLNKFKHVSRKNWIKGISNTNNSGGITFEKMIGKESDSMYFPDYEDVEIKTSSRFSRYPIGLFGMAFDGPNLYETNLFLQKHGENDIEYIDKKKLQYVIPYRNIVKTRNKEYLSIDIVDDKLYVLVYDNNLNLIEREAYIELSNLKERIELKLNNLALVYYSKKQIDNDLYFRYYKIDFYKLKSFDDFIELIKKGYIKLFLNLRVSRSGDYEGRQRNKGIEFKLPKENIDLLFDKTYSYDSDYERKCSNFVIMK